MNDYFCVLPFYGVEIGHNITKNIYCCRLPAGRDIDNVRKSILSQQRSADCSTCWKLEDQGLNSERQLHNSAFDFYLDRDLEKIEKDVVDGRYSSQIIKLATSNLCNGTCVTCGSDASSAWASLEHKKINYNKIDQNEIEKINWKDIKQLSFVGGEPLLEKLNFEILDRLAETNNTECFISIVTNGSCELTSGQCETLSKFKNLNICLSIDGVGTRFEYMRYPLGWNLLCQNLGYFKKITSNISVSAMISNVNIFYYTELIEFFKSNQLSYLCKQIEFPKYFTPGNLPGEFKQLVLDNNPQYRGQVQSFLNMGSFNDNLFLQCCQELQRQDKLKNINISHYLPVNLLQESTVELGNSGKSFSK
jgi:hypothetical protein